MIDAQDKVLGRLASETAKLLMGKHKVSFSPGADTGDFVVIVNSSKVAVTGNKSSKKIYYKHSGYPGGIKSANFEQIIKRIITDFTTTSALINKFINEKSALDANPTA